MDVRRSLGLHVFALALFLLLCVSLNSGGVIDRGESIGEIFSGQATLDERANEDDGPLTRHRRGFRIKLPKSKGSSGPGHTYHPAPKAKDIPGIPNLERAKPKTPVEGGGGLRQRYVDKDNKKIHEWDSRHGELERYDKRGKHEGSYNPKTGEKVKDAVPGRRIEP